LIAPTGINSRTVLQNKYLANQVGIVADEKHQPADALPLIEEAYRLAQDYGYSALSEQIRPILEKTRAMLE